MRACYSCGRPISEGEAFARITIADTVYLVCCPMCLSAVEAGNVQRQMVSRRVDDPLMRVSVEYIPALLVGGDSFCVRAPEPNKRHLVVSDISGHGVTSSLVSARLEAEIEALTGGDVRPEQLARRLNEWMREHLRDGTAYMTLFHAVVDFAKEELTYLNCGHLPQLLYSVADGSLRRLESQTFPVGLFDSSALDDARPTTVHFEAGDYLLLFTDGLTDMVLDGTEEIGLEGLLSRLSQSEAASGRWSSVLEAIASRQRSSTEDDIFAAMIELQASR